MTDQERPTEDEEQQESELAPEVPTSFATKGEGWSDARTKTWTSSA